MNSIGRQRSGSELFGSINATQILIVIECFQTTHASEIAGCLKTSKRVVAYHLDKLEDDGIIIREIVGRNRVVSLNPRFFAAPELSALIRRLREENQELWNHLSEFRRRPRRKGKSIDVD